MIIVSHSVCLNACKLIIILNDRRGLNMPEEKKAGDPCPVCKEKETIIKTDRHTVFIPMPGFPPPGMPQQRTRYLFYCKKCGHEEII